jgi:Flp pilus assembly protein TadD
VDAGLSASLQGGLQFSFYGDVCRYSEAIAQFELARQMNPNDVVVEEDLMEMLTATGEFERARCLPRHYAQAPR